jgi:hypothetical protein
LLPKVLLIEQCLYLRTILLGRRGLVNRNLSPRALKKKQEINLSTKINKIERENIPISWMMNAKLPK